MRKSKLNIKNSGLTLKGSAILAMFIMVASALIVTGSGWSFRDPNPTLAVQVGDIEPDSSSCPWDEFTLFRAPPYERNSDR